MTVRLVLVVGLAVGYLLVILGSIGMVLFALKFPFSSSLRDLAQAMERLGPFNGYQVWIGAWLLIIFGPIIQLASSIAMTVCQR
jgi:hypothetical protein